MRCVLVMERSLVVEVFLVGILDIRGFDVGRAGESNRFRVSAAHGFLQRVLRLLRVVTEHGSGQLTLLDRFAKARRRTYIDVPVFIQPCQSFCWCLNMFGR